MNTNANVEAVSTINYQFTAIPTHFIYLMDNDCFKLFAILIQKESYWKNKNMLKDGYFIKSITELGEEMNIKNRKDIRLIIEALYRKDLISIQVQPQKHNTAKFKLNWNVINEYLDKPIYDVIEFEEKISKLNRNEDITYINSTKCTTTLVTTLVKSDNNVTNDGTNMGTELGTKCTTTKDNINNINKKNINIYTSNIIEENCEKIEEVGLIENPTSEKEEKEIDNNNTFQLFEVGMLEEKEENITPSMNATFNDNLSNLIDKLNNCTCHQDLDDKVIKLCGWVEKHNNDYTPSELESIKERISNSYINCKEKIESMEKMVTSIEEDFFNQVQLDPQKAKTVNQIKEEKKVETTPSIKTKEELIKNLQAFQESLVTYENLEDAKHQLHLYCQLEDKLIREYELTSMVGDIVNEIDTQIKANKAFLDTFNLQDEETYYDDYTTQEKGIKSYMLIHVDDNENYPF